MLYILAASSIGFGTDSNPSVMLVYKIGSAIKKDMKVDRPWEPNKRNAIPEDFGIMPEYEGLPYDLVVDGEIMRENLKKQ